MAPPAPWRSSAVLWDRASSDWLERCYSSLEALDELTADRTLQLDHRERIAALTETFVQLGDEADFGTDSTDDLRNAENQISRLRSALSEAAVTPGWHQTLDIVAADIDALKDLS